MGKLGKKNKVKKGKEKYAANIQSIFCPLILIFFFCFLLFFLVNGGRKKTGTWFVRFSKRSSGNTKSRSFWSMGRNFSILFSITGGGRWEWFRGKAIIWNYFLSIDELKVILKFFSRFFFSVPFVKFVSRKVSYLISICF